MARPLNNAARASSGSSSAKPSACAVVDRGLSVRAESRRLRRPPSGANFNTGLRVARRVGMVGKPGGVGRALGR